ncbi:MAG: hypothetical protein F4089_00045 [Gammaproteobacteria bacterium]|nr:hypothetical protein [Gammaproteobacteria bacterium]
MVIPVKFLAARASFIDPSEVLLARRAGTNRHGSSNERRGAWSVPLGDPRGKRNRSGTDIDDDVWKTGRRDRCRRRGGTIGAVGVETHAAGHISFVERVIGIVQRCADKRHDQDAKA